VDRRCFLMISLVGALAAPRGARAQQSGGRTPIVGYVVPETPGCKPTPMGEAFLTGLRKQGYIVGRSVIVDRRCYTKSEDLQDILTEMARQNVSVIVALGPEAVLTARRLISTTPIVMLHADPVAAGVVQNLRLQSLRRQGPDCP
jgi:hypothetical protein